jgi:hypothetical protein
MSLPRRDFCPSHFSTGSKEIIRWTAPFVCLTLLQHVTVLPFSDLEPPFYASFAIRPDHPLMA